MSLPSDELNLPKSDIKVANNSIKRFSAGAVIGLVIFALQWGSYTYFLGESIPLVRAITFCILLSIACGLITLKWGYKTIESLLQLLGY